MALPLNKIISKQLRFRISELVHSTFKNFSNLVFITFKNAIHLKLKTERIKPD